MSRRGGGLWLSLESPQGIQSSLHHVRYNLHSLLLSYNVSFSRLETCLLIRENVENAYLFSPETEI